MPDKEETLATHLEALRSTLIRCLVAVALIFVPAFFTAPYCIDFLTKTLVKSAPVLHYFAPMEVFILQMKVAFVIAILILAAILTPPDVLSQLILATPTYLLFELGLFFARHSR